MVVNSQASCQSSLATCETLSSDTWMARFRFLNVCEKLLPSMPSSLETPQGRLVPILPRFVRCNLHQLVGSAHSSASRFSASSVITIAKKPLSYGHHGKSFDRHGRESALLLFSNYSPTHSWKSSISRPSPLSSQVMFLLMSNNPPARLSYSVHY